MHIYRGNEWLKYLDPVASALIVVIIFASTIGLVRQCTAILMQHVPEHVALGRLRRDILAVPGVDGIRDLHVWELSSDMAVATVHVQVSDVTLFTPVINHIKKLFHQREIHSSTIQPEISTLTKTKDLPTSCVDSCEEDWCCSNNNEIMLTNYKI
jgi:zinc transporter 1